MPAERLVNLPDDISDRVAATLMLKGSPPYLFRQTHRRRKERRSCSKRRLAASAYRVPWAGRSASR
jgi:hypothetical protein